MDRLTGHRSLEALRSSLTGTPDRRRHRLRSLLVIAGNALSVALLVGATMLIRSVINLYEKDPAFDPTNVYAMPVNLSQTRDAQGANRLEYAERMLAEARRIPGVQSATFATSVPAW